MDCRERIKQSDFYKDLPPRSLEEVPGLWADRMMAATGRRAAAAWDLEMLQEINPQPEEWERRDTGNLSSWRSGVGKRILPVKEEDLDRSSSQSEYVSFLKLVTSLTSAPS